MNKLYTNIGDKVCKVAVICGIAGIVMAAIGLLVTFIGLVSDEMTTWIIGLAAGVLGAICVIASWPLYAFGQITNDVHAMRSSGTQSVAAAQFSDLPEL